MRHSIGHGMSHDRAMAPHLNANMGIHMAKIWDGA